MCGFGGRSAIAFALDLVHEASELPIRIVLRDPADRLGVQLSLRTQRATKLLVPTLHVGAVLAGLLLDALAMLPHLHLDFVPMILDLATHVLPL